MPISANCLSSAKAKDSTITLIPVGTNSLEGALQQLGKTQRAWVVASGFEARHGTYAAIAGKTGEITKVLIGIGESTLPTNSPWWLASVATKLPAGDFVFDANVEAGSVEAGALGWCLAHYVFDRYKKSTRTKKRRLVGLPKAACTQIKHTASAMAKVRDLVNTPAEDMGPSDLQDAVEAIAESYGATSETIVGDDLLDHNFPAIHAVGRAAATGREPRLIDLRWGPEGAPSLTLVGKGVCFDSGGLDIKPSAGMRTMKKDMGGAAHALALAELIMASKLNVNLRLLISAVENSISAAAYRPGDIINTRKGLTVEIGNTDAEGRLVLCDALALACEEAPDLLIDFATLTGAARVALGADLPATFTNSEKVWSALESSAVNTQDPLWRMPLWAGYDKELSSPIADLSNVGDGGQAGAITAALYLQRFVEPTVPWVHIDVFAWNKKTRAGRPVGGEAQGLRASFDAVKAYLPL